MLKRELKVTRKSLIIWAIICISLFGISYAVYPMIANDSKDMLDKMLQAFPQEMLKMFNMDISDISTVFGWFKTEGYTFLILILGLYSGILGSNILLKEESDKTIEYLFSKPITRNEIVKSKLLCGLINIIIIVFLITIFNVIGMYLSNNLELKPLLMLNIGSLLICLPIFTITLFISTFFSKTKKTMGIGIGVVFISYFLQIISSMGNQVEFFKYFSIFTLSDSRHIIETGNINIICIIIALLISVSSIIGTYIRYNRKELV